MDINKFFRAVLDQDENALRPFFHPRAIIKWHCSNECFRADEYIRANCEYPGDWAGEIERIEQFADRIILAARVFPEDGSASFHVISFIRIEDDRIIEMDEYWADDTPPPQWRIDMNIGKPIEKQSVSK